MVAAAYNFVSKLLSLSWLTGPIFDKELRVSSRRRRNYVLRFVYLALLTIFLALVWLQEVPSGGSGLYSASRMAEAGKNIILLIIWFQFIATQLVSAIMLSTSISDEIYNRTLGLLMTTPINSFQIVTGKLFSKLLQLILLLAISLPLLAIVRLFGGVPWLYIISGLCVTLTTVIFIGSLSLFFSIFSRRAYVVIILIILTICSLFAVLPVLAAMLVHTFVSEDSFFAVLSYLNPYVLLFFETDRMMSARAAGPAVWAWAVHCGIMLAASALWLFLSVIVVRRVALKQATGQLGVRPQELSAENCAGPGSPDLQARAHLSRPVRGPAVLWKELRSPVFGRRRLAVYIAAGIGLVLLAITYAFFADQNMLDEGETHMVYAAIFVGLGILFTIILPATCITSEKESRSWPLLLATTLSDWQILLGKFGGVVRRSLPIWCVLFGHVVFFTLVGVIHPIAVVQMVLLAAWVIAFLSGTGFYFSARFKHTTTAVIANFALPVFVWGLGPLVIGLVFAAVDIDTDFIGVYMDTNPFVHAVVVMDAAAGEGDLGNYHWLELGGMDVVEASVWMLICTAGYVLGGLLFAWRAKCRFRRNIF